MIRHVRYVDQLIFRQVICLDERMHTKKLKEKIVDFHEQTVEMNYRRSSSTSLRAIFVLTEAMGCLKRCVNRTFDRWRYHILVVRLSRYVFQSEICLRIHQTVEC